MQVKASDLDEIIFKQRDHFFPIYAVLFLIGNLCYFSLKYEPNQFFINSLTFFGLILLALLLKLKDILSLRFFIICLLYFISSFLISYFRTNLNQPIAINSQIEDAKIEGEIETIKPTPWGYNIVIKDLYIESLESKKTPTKIRITAPKSKIEHLMQGDFVKFRAQLKPPTEAILPSGYDFEFISYFNEIGATGNLKSEIEIMKYKEEGLDHYINKVRKWLYNLLIKKLGILEGNFAAALFLGETGGIKKDVLDSMRFAGVSHVLCVSGLHLSLVAMIFYMSIRFLLNLSDYLSFNTNIKLIAAIFSLIGSFLYLVLTNFQIAATRAFIMVAIFILSIILSRSPHPIRSLSLAAIILLTIHPEYSTHPSFQLSFLAVVSLISGYEIYRRCKIDLFFGIFSKVFTYIISNIYTSLIASIATAPIVAYHFHIFSTYSVLANLLIVPVISILVMPIGVFLIIFNFLPGADYLFDFIKICINFVISSAEFSNSLPYSIIQTGYITNLSISLYIIGFFILSLTFGKTRLIGIILIISSALSQIFHKKPDIVINLKQNLIVKKEDNKLIFYKKPSRYSKDYLKNWFGIDQYIIDQNNQNKCIIQKNCSLFYDLESNIIYHKNQKLDPKYTYFIYTNRDDLKFKKFYKSRFRFQN